MDDILTIPELANMIVGYMGIDEGIIVMARLRCVCRRLAAAFTAKTAVILHKDHNLRARAYSVGPLSIKVINGPRESWTGFIRFGDNKYSNTTYHTGVSAIFRNGSKCRYRMKLAAFVAVIRVFGLGGIVGTALEPEAPGLGAADLDVRYDGRGTAKCGDIVYALESGDRARKGGVYYKSWSSVSWSPGDIGNYSNLVRMRRVDFYDWGYKQLYEKNELK